MSSVLPTDTTSQLVETGAFPASFLGQYDDRPLHDESYDEMIEDELGEDE